VCYTLGERTVKTVAARLPKPRNKTAKVELVREHHGGDVYEYYPLGQYVVAAPGVCGGRPSIKYTRIDARHVIGSLRAGDSPREISRYYKIPVAAVEEAVALSDRYDYEESYA
jgi:uncharacterized protein (DUF433 family)